MKKIIAESLQFPVYLVWSIQTKLPKMGKEIIWLSQIGCTLVSLAEGHNVPESTLYPQPTISRYVDSGEYVLYNTTWCLVKRVGGVFGLKCILNHAKFQ